MTTVDHPAARPALAPWYAVQRTDRDRLIRCIQLAEERGWKATLEHLQETLFALETGRIARAF